MGTQSNRTLCTFQTVDNTPMLPKSSDKVFVDSYENAQSKAAIYVRLSVEDVDKANKLDDSESIQNQKLMLMDYATEKGWPIVKLYSDDDYSGLDRDRPSFKQLLSDAQSGKFNIVLCKTLSRFTRDIELVEKYIYGVFPELGIRFVSLVDNVDTMVKSSKKGSQIQALINQWYCEELSENIRTVFRKKMESGQYLGSFAPYGYGKDPKDRHKLVVDPEAAEVVRKIYKLYLNGYGCQQIAKSLTEQGITTPSAYKAQKGLNFKAPNSGKYSQPYGVWANNSVKRILTNPVYVGTLAQGKGRKVSYKSKKVIMTPSSDWVVLEDNHEPIVSKQDFDLVQKLMAGRRQVHKPKEGYYSGTAQAHVLAGRIRCMDCGGNMSNSAPARNGEHYLRCTRAYKTKTKSPSCTPHTIKLERLVELVEERFKLLFAEYFSDASEREILKGYCLKSGELKRQGDEQKKELERLRGRLGEMDMALTRAYTDMAGGRLSEEDFTAVKARLCDEKNLLKKWQAALELEIGEITSRLEASSGEKLLESYMEFQGLTHGMVNQLIDFIEVGEKNEAGEQRVVVNWAF